MAKAGDRVKLKTKKETVEGVLMPSSDDNIVMVKLDNGYNVGFEKKEVINVKKIKTKEEKKETKKGKIKQNKKLPTIAILHTGGTVASKVDYETGAVNAKFSAEDLIEMFPELKKIANIKTELVSNMMSEDILFSDYQKIASAVEKQVKAGVAGIIIGHGTDTLGVTVAALSFMLEEISVPVLLVGSQRSTDRGSSDAFQNLICAAEFMAKSDFAGVAICMHHSSDDKVCAILPGTKTRKMHTSRRDAFKVINDSPIALVDYNNRKIEFIKKKYRKKSKGGKVLVKEKFEEKVGLLKTHPNMDPKLFEFFTKNYKALVIEGTGLGHAPTNLGINLKNYEALKKFIKKGGIVAVTSQCLYGRVNPAVYTNLRRLSSIGCIFCEDMLPETAFVKLAWLLGNHPKEEAKKLLPKNLRGEINKRIEYQEDFLD